MEDWAELSPTSDPDAPGPSEPCPVPDSAFLGFMTALKNRLAATTSVLAATATVAERPGHEGPPAGSEPLPSMPSRITAAQAFATPVLAARPVPMPMEMPVPAASLAAASAKSKAAAGPKAVPPRPGPVDGSAPSSSSAGNAVGKVTASGSSGRVMAKHQTGVYPAKNVSVLPFKRQNVSQSERWELDRRNRKEKRRRDRRERERQNGE